MTIANPPAAESVLTQFQWTPQPQAEAFLREHVDAFVAALPAAAEMARRMHDETGTRFHDWIDTLMLPSSPAIRERLKSVGYQPEREWENGVAGYIHPGGVFPRVGLHHPMSVVVMIKVERVEDFAKAWNLPSMSIKGAPFATLREIRVAATPQAELWAVERHGRRTYSVEREKDGSARSHALQTFRHRRRDFDTDDHGFAHTSKLVDDAIREIGVDAACDAFFAAEREYWQSRNNAARVQKQRQDRLGLGWANHDHHTYRCSRENFAKLIPIQEKLGLVARERFYAGMEAGWGAQVMEQAETGIVTFNDVDLSPEELVQDFAHEPLTPRDKLGTVGLWCALHGDSMLQAGMHHLEAQFDFESLRQQLEAEANVKTMKPFTDFPHLRQAFTEGERWKVDPERIDHLLKDARITSEQAEKFRTEGAIGSHLENLERNAGFKGFNQKGVSEIISATDPRRQ